MPLKPLEKYTEALGTYILCIHHINQEFPYQDFKTRFQEIHNSQLKITPPYIDNPAPTPTHPNIKPNQLWTNTLIYLEHAEDNIEAIPCPPYVAYRHPKFSKNSYYTDGSFIPSKPEELDEPNDIARYDIYNNEKNIKISLKLPGLQNIVRAELTAIHDILKLTATDTKPTYIFIDNLNSIYLINTHLKHPTSHNNHPDKLLL
jgi:hypothetical protein